MLSSRRSIAISATTLGKEAAQHLAGKWLIEIADAVLYIETSRFGTAGQRRIVTSTGGHDQ